MQSPPLSGSPCPSAASPPCPHPSPSPPLGGWGRRGAEPAAAANKRQRPEPRGPEKSLDERAKLCYYLNTAMHGKPKPPHRPQYRTPKRVAPAQGGALAILRPGSPQGTKKSRPIKGGSFANYSPTLPPPPRQFNSRKLNKTYVILFNFRQRESLQQNHRFVQLFAHW